LPKYGSAKPSSGSTKPSSGSTKPSIYKIMLHGVYERIMGIAVGEEKIGLIYIRCRIPLNALKGRSRLRA